jgi:hypothetical protein
MIYREADDISIEPTWGADPLEFVGGFRTLQYDINDTFRSSLPANGAAKWNVTEATQTNASSTSAEVALSISHSNVDWDFLKVVYGWAAVQYQSWARGELSISGNATRSIILYTDAVLEFWVDDAHYFGGDFFTFRKAPPVLHLTPGTHKIDLRLARDVRAFGGILAPTIDVVVRAELASGTLELAKPGILMSDVVDGILATPVGSVVLRNGGEEDVELIGISPADVRHPISLQDQDSQRVLAERSHLTAEQKKHTPPDSLGIVIVSGQTRPVSFNISLSTHNVSSVQYSLTYKPAGASQLSTLHVSQNITKTSIYEPHKITYLHPGSIASYAMLRPPAKNATCVAGSNSGLTVLMNLHGAGLEADNGMVAHALDPVHDLCAWALFPTGVTPWSSDDWRKCMPRSTLNSLTALRQLGIRRRGSGRKQYPGLDKQYRLARPRRRRKSLDRLRPFKRRTGHLVRAHTPARQDTRCCTSVGLRIDTEQVARSPICNARLTLPRICTI